ncbi:DUF423 domain-containing protein [Anatilimnocola sp. NA78]|uniref:DUF423 domain-containing protein n=1 Tax=Anatilimnocola sp. NA78 TaxID=3415683 RepID=UPI003CE57603
MSAKMMLLVAAILGAAAVTLGAFGAHGLPGYVEKQSLTVELFAKRLHDWDVASQYLMYHALAMFGCGILAHLRPSLSLSLASWFFTLGAIIFSGMLYALVLLNLKILGAIVPIGGVLMIFGWITLAWAGGGYCRYERPTNLPK